MQVLSIHEGHTRSQVGTIWDKHQLPSFLVGGLEPIQLHRIRRADASVAVRVHQLCDLTSGFGHGAVVHSHMT